MEEVTQKDGRTILFVSHNLAAVQRLCKKTILIENGKVKKTGETGDVIDFYTRDKANQTNPFHTDNRGRIKITDIKITNEEDSILIKSDNKIKIKISYESDFKEIIPDTRILISITSERSQKMVLRLDSHVSLKSFRDIKSSGEITCQTETINLVEGKYSMDILFLMQDTKGERTLVNTQFDVITDIDKYEYTLNPDKNVCDYLVKYNFKQ